MSQNPNGLPAVDEAGAIFDANEVNDDDKFGVYAVLDCNIMEFSIGEQNWDNNVCGFCNDDNDDFSDRL